MAEMEATILGGLPVVVDLTWEDADRSVGVYGGYCVGSVYTRRTRKRDGKIIDRPIPKSWWDRIMKNGDYERLQEQADDYED